MTTVRLQKVRHVLTGVLRQAAADARVGQVRVAGDDAPARFVRDLCISALGPDSLGPDGLLVSAENKTALLLGSAAPGDVLLLGDLYYSQVVELAGGARLSDEHAALATACGGVGALDDALARFYDRREPWANAVSRLPVSARDVLKDKLEAARFERARLGLVPKLGARTIGIDLYA